MYNIYILKKTNNITLLFSAKSGVTRFPNWANDVKLMFFNVLTVLKFVFQKIDRSCTACPYPHYILIAKKFMVIGASVPPNRF